MAVHSPVPMGASSAVGVVALKNATIPKCRQKHREPVLKLLAQHQPCEVGFWSVSRLPEAGVDVLHHDDALQSFAGNAGLGVEIEQVEADPHDIVLDACIERGADCVVRLEVQPESDEVIVVALTG